MTLPNDELTTTRLGGGRRAWLVALAALVVLGSFVYLGLTGPTTTPRGTPKPNPSTAVAEVTTRPAPPTPNLNEVTSIRADPTAPQHYQYLGTGLTLNGHGTLAILDPIGPDQYRGIYRIPYALAGPTARLEFDAVTASVSNDDLDRIGTWNFPVDQIRSGACCPSVTVLDTAEAPQDKTISIPDFSRIATNGYRLTVTIQNESDAALMTIDVTVNPDPNFPDESFAFNIGAPDHPFVISLGAFAPGSYDGQALIPSALMDTTVTGSLTALPLSVPTTGGPATAGTWSIVLSARPSELDSALIEAHVDGRAIAAGEPLIRANGYDLLVQEIGSQGHSQLNVILNVRPMESLPTR